MSTLWGKPKSRNVQIEHWLHSLEEVEQVARSVEPKLVSTTAKWKGIAQNCKEIATDLCQIFNKNDPHYEVLLASYTSSRKFEDEQHQVTKTNELRDRAVERLRHYLSEIQQLKAQCVEEQKLRSRLEHYQAKVKSLEKRNADSTKLERNVSKLKDVETRHRTFVDDITKQMEICWKKHVTLFAEACVALWYTEFCLSAKLFESAEPLRPFIARHLQLLGSDASNQHDNPYSSSLHQDVSTVAFSQFHDDSRIEQDSMRQSPISEEAFGSLPYDSMQATNTNMETASPHLVDQVWRISRVFNSATSSSNSTNSSTRMMTAGHAEQQEQHHTTMQRRKDSNHNIAAGFGNSHEAYSVVSQSPDTTRHR